MGLGVQEGLPDLVVLEVLLYLLSLEVRQDLEHLGCPRLRGRADPGSHCLLWAQEDQVVR